MPSHQPTPLGVTTRDALNRAFDVNTDGDITCSPLPQSSLFAAANADHAIVLSQPSIQTDPSVQCIAAFNALTPHGSFAPCTPLSADTPPPVTPANCLPFLATNRAQIEEILHTARNAIQFDVSLAPKSSCTEQLADPRLHTAISQCIAALCDVAFDWVEVQNNEVYAASLSFHCETSSVRKFENTVSDIRRHHSEQIRLRGIGPLPATAFVAWTWEPKSGQIQHRKPRPQFKQTAKTA